MDNHDNSQLSRVAKRREEDKFKDNNNFWNKDRKELLNKILLGFVTAIVALFVIGATTFFIYAKSAPTLSENKLASAGNTVIYDADGDKIATLGTENRSYIKDSQIPQQLKDAVVSIEDRRFYKHHGVDPYRIVAAAFSNVTGSSAGLQGGSTLDQQLIKLSFFSTKRSDQTLKRKSQEAWLAMQMDRTYTKDQILGFYVNKVFMGNGTYGMQTAAKYYFNKSLSELNLAQTALIAGIPNAPSSYNPYSNPQLATQRRNEVLNAMVENEKISQAQANEAKQVPVTSGLVESHKQKTTTSKERIADPYLKEVVSEAKAKGYDPYQGSLKIYTNLDMDAQERLYDIVNTSNYVSFPTSTIQVASTIVDPNNGAVIAQIGGRNLGDVTFGLNRAVQTDRSSGSTAKPVMDYAPAIENLDWATYHALNDSRYNYPGTSTPLYNWDKSYKGNMTMRQALVQSRNVPAIRALDAVGLDRAKTFIGNLGYSTKDLTYANGIGLPSSTLQNAAAYAAFANGGTYYKPSYINKIQTADGQIKDFSNKGKRVMKASTAYMITDMLKQVITSSSGTGDAARISGLYQAGKTGTTAYPSDVSYKYPSNATMDSWFDGYTKNYSMSVWVGYDHQYTTPYYLTNESKLAQQIYRAMMSYLSQSVTNSDWQKPSDVYVRTVAGQRELYLAGSSAPTIFSRRSSSSSNRSSSSSTSSSEQDEDNRDDDSSEKTNESSDSNNQQSSATTNNSTSTSTSTSAATTPNSSAPAGGGQPNTPQTNGR
ncbi:multimodular transpeptidase-transglycosylase pbp 1a [Ligilactobacillus hayakitensis DSM 18933 = JCM 14209]|uniref:Multimodular transpeptidase-transglycosylase pbp 1a n=1 Tax=Ligilactobacillus hayakitensis DSM 18933 = JCM 14209 TaxID=1423755 RepID=A0A0R1WMC9_9LACO|nr:PBP1A family penicillin-binding protein [Ligilactobacillus hayakitensis]KRM19015.1 multimodular transpeptidase-transglycosylase pbp 1a [Ligilactobacillus hayakitensis DSM 18933 = JCM 14209]